MYLQFLYIATLKTFHTAQRKIKCHVKYLTVLKHWDTYTTTDAMMYQVPSSDEEGDESSDIVSASPNV